MGVACQFCDQVDGLPLGVHLSSSGKRFGGYLLEGVLLVFTAGIGWLIWSAIVWSKGQTPAKQLLNMRCVDLRRSRSASWGRMCLREIVGKFVISILSWVALGIPLFWLVWDKNKQELWDKMAGTIVVNDSNDQLDPKALRTTFGSPPPGEVPAPPPGPYLPPSS